MLLTRVSKEAWCIEMDLFLRTCFKFRENWKIPLFFLAFWFPLCMYVCASAHPPLVTPTMTSQFSIYKSFPRSSTILSRAPITWQRIRVRWKNPSNSDKPGHQNALYEILVLLASCFNEIFPGLFLFLCMTENRLAENITPDAASFNFTGDWKLNFFVRDGKKQEYCECGKWASVGYLTP